jgi:hypothetical protein
MNVILKLIAVAYLILVAVADVNAGRRRGCSSGSCGSNCSGGSCGSCPSGACQQGCPTSCPNGQCVTGPGGGCVGDQCTATGTIQTVSEEAVDALDEVNAKRKQLGLPAYIRDDNLTKGAFHVVKYRSKMRIHGHHNDHSGLPPGVTALAAGAEGDASTPAMRASWNPAVGFAACCAHERVVKDFYDRPHTPTHAGAAKVIVGNEQFCQIFVSVGPTTRK